MLGCCVKAALNHEEERAKEIAQGGSGKDVAQKRSI